MKRLALALILLVALALRLANAVFLPWQGGDRVVSDMKGYDRAAVALLNQQPLSVHTAEKHLFHPLGSDTYHPPGYYYFLAGVYAVAGHSYLAVRIVQALLDALTCLLVYSISRQIFGEAAGLLAAALAAVYPPFVFYTGVLLTETLSTFFLAAATWALLKTFGVSKQTPKVCWLALAGLLLGLAALTRNVLLLAAPLALLWMLFVAQGWPGWSGSARYALALLLPLALVIAPITVRNYQIHQRFILISDNGGVNFFLGHGGTQRLKDQVRNLPGGADVSPAIGVSSRTEPQEDAYFYQLGWQYIRQHPLQTLRELPAKAAYLYWASDYWPASDAQANLLRAADLVFWKLLLLPLALLGLLLVRGQKLRHSSRCLRHSSRCLRHSSRCLRHSSRCLRRAALLYLLTLSSAAIPLISWVMPRYRIPVLPQVIVLAAGAGVELCRRLAQRSQCTLEGGAS